MKKFALMLLLVASVIFAASPLSAEGMMFGIKGGLNIANLAGDDVDNASWKAGMAGGAFMCYDVTEIFAVQPELLFTMKGAKSDHDDGEDTWKINYIEIPLLLKVNLPTEGAIDPSLYVGPGIGFLLSSKVSNGREVDQKDETASLDIGIIAGGGLAYRLETGAVGLELRYEVGMTSLAKNEDEDTGDKPDIKNSVISIMVGYAFAF
jgi:hypothetical protein